MMFIFLILLSCYFSFPQKTKTKVLDIEKTLFVYSTEGNGLPCIVFSGSENIGSRLYPEQFKKNIMLIHADPKNITPEQLKKMTLNTIIDEIDRVRKAMGLKKIGLMGHSMFGLLPFEYALKYPKQTLFIISTGSTPYINNKYFLASQKYWKDKASEKRKNIHKNNLLGLKKNSSKTQTPGKKFINRYLADIPMRFYDPDYDMTEIWKDVKLNIPFAYYFWGKLMKDFDNTSNYKKIRTPILVMSGKYDFGAPYFLWEPFKKIIPDFTFYYFRKAGHNPMLERPGKFTKIIRSWINKKIKGPQ